MSLPNSTTSVGAVWSLLNVLVSLGVYTLIHEWSSKCCLPEGMMFYENLDGAPLLVASFSQGMCSLFGIWYSRECSKLAENKDVQSTSCLSAVRPSRFEDTLLGTFTIPTQRNPLSASTNNLSCCFKQFHNSLVITQITFKTQPITIIKIRLPSRRYYIDSQASCGFS